MRLPVLLIALAPILQDPPVPPPGNVAARLNSEVITWDEIDLRLGGAEDLSPDLRRAELRRVVQERLFMQEAKRLQLAISEAQIDNRIESIKKQLGRPGDPRDLLDERFEVWLRQRRRTLSEYREDLRVELTGNAVYSRLFSDSVRNPGLHSTLLTEFVSPDEVRAYYQANPDQFKPIFNVTVMRIALRFATEEEKQLKFRLADSLKRKADAGGDFQVLAIYYSDVRPGESRYPGHRELRPEASEYSEEVNRLLFHDLAEGAVSAPIVDKNTVNLFKLEHREDEKGISFEDAQARIRALLENKKREENRVLLRNELLKRCYLDPSDLFK